MADPFGTGAGIVGVIGLAFQITQVVVQFGLDWKDAPDNVKTFMVELGTLKTVLSETNSNILLNPDFAAAFENRPSLLLSQIGPHAPPVTDTKQMLEICQIELDSLLNELRRRGQGHRFGWERLKSAFLAKNTRNSVVNLCRQCQTWNNMLSIDAVVLGAATYKEVRDMRREQQEGLQAEAEVSLVIKSGIDESNRWQENQEELHKRQAILDWLTPIDYAPQQNDFIARREEGTGLWFLDSSEFQTWLETDKQTLFCPGIPGAGKTILTSIVVDYLQTKIQAETNIGIAYLFCNFRRQDEQNVNALLMSLLKQLAQGLPSLPESVNSLYTSHKYRCTRPTFDEISNVLQSVGTLYSRIFILIDALDECQAFDGCRSELLAEIFAFQADARANIFTTSRSSPEINEYFEDSIRLEIRASVHDVRRYLDSNISQLSRCVVRSSDLQDEIRAEIVKVVDGMYVASPILVDKAYRL